MAVCEKCAALDQKIARCERLLALLTDKLTIDGMERLLESYREEKQKLHPELRSQQHQ
jgi:hypothetical protein